MCDLYPGALHSCPLSCCRQAPLSLVCKPCKPQLLKSSRTKFPTLAVSHGHLELTVRECSAVCTTLYLDPCLHKATPHSADHTDMNHSSLIPFHHLFDVQASTQSMTRTSPMVSRRSSQNTSWSGTGQKALPVLTLCYPARRSVNSTMRSLATHLVREKLTSTGLSPGSLLQGKACINKMVSHHVHPSFLQYPLPNMPNMPHEGNFQARCYGIMLNWGVSSPHRPSSHKDL